MLILAPTTPLTGRVFEIHPLNDFSARTSFITGASGGCLNDQADGWMDVSSHAMARSINSPRRHITFAGTGAASCFLLPKRSPPPQPASCLVRRRPVCDGRSLARGWLASPPHDAYLSFTTQSAWSFEESPRRQTKPLTTRTVSHTWLGSRTGRPSPALRASLPRWWDSLLLA